MIYALWIIGGLIAIVLAFTFREQYDQLIYSVPKETMPRIGYAWVGGSIWGGGMVGGIISVIYSLTVTNRDWKAADNNV